VSCVTKAKQIDPVTCVDRNGAKAIHWAAGCGHVKVMKYLVDGLGRDPTTSTSTIGCCSPHEGQKGKRSFGGRTPLHWAARNGHAQAVAYLVKDCEVDLEAETLDGTTAFCWAAWQGHLDVMR
jgi:ankyrin repeat protein